MVTNGLRALWDEPRPAHPPVRVWRDWVLLALALAGTALEAVLRDDPTGLVPAVTVSVVVAFGLLWRRTHPLATVAVAFGALLVFDLARAVTIEATGMFSTAAALILAYALLRWGAGRQAVIGLATILVWLAVTHLADASPLDEVVAGYGSFLFAAALGASIRFHATTRARDIEQAKLRLRNELARELHDTVGHHVSAITIQAQAGRAMAAADPDRALGVLDTIEAAATRAMQELRAMVGVLRESDQARLAPLPGLADIERLAGDVEGRLRVEVHVQPDLDDLPPSVGTTLARIAQEAVTNATRHARGASLVLVAVTGTADRVHLGVHDDGEPVPPGPARAGFGLLGMAERSALLGGGVQAGPDPDGGWTVAVSLPRDQTTPGPAKPAPPVP
ncbi:MAG: hypothetical protein JJT89_06045 [Nitriliruptoraceae bacterium]|nr:hypothetical protein [Nitriliruptoraceae bacterium]